MVIVVGGVGIEDEGGRLVERGIEIMEVIRTEILETEVEKEVEISHILGRGRNRGQGRDLGMILEIGVVVEEQEGEEEIVGGIILLRIIIIRVKVLGIGIGLIVGVLIE